MTNILDQIVAEKQEEVKRLKEQFDPEALRRLARPGPQRFYPALVEARKTGRPFLIAEFKRKSPSEGWINRDVAVADQVGAYVAAGVSAVSVLTDTPFFGGSYADLQAAAQTLQAGKTARTPLLLQKDFVIDPIQIYLARLQGADIILLIAAILTPERLSMLRQIAERLGMGVLVEVHNLAELDRIKHLDFPVLGINSRDLKTFRTALNRVNVLAKHAGRRFIIAESGIRDYRDMQIVRKADGFLIGTTLMHARVPEAQNRGAGIAHLNLSAPPSLLFKACGIRDAAMLCHPAADYVGVNFSSASRRRIDPQALEGVALPAHAVAVFYQNPESEIRETLARYPFRIVQLYAGDATPEFVRSLRQKVFLACRIRETADLEQLEDYAADVDLFILDGAIPGSGERIAATIPADFPYPFLLAGGLHAGNLGAVSGFANCIGVDIATGIETDGAVDEQKIRAIAQQLSAQPLQSS